MDKMQENTRKSLCLGHFGTVPIDRLSEVYIDTDDGKHFIMYQTKIINTLGSWVYDGAACLAKYFESTISTSNSSKSTPLEGKRLIELGAGTGVVGFMAAYYGADAYITDLEPMLPLLQYNVDMNKDNVRGTVTAKTLKWEQDCSEFLPTYDYLILANCIYYIGTFEPLLETMLKLSDVNTVILACYEVRTPGIKKFIDKWHRHIENYFEVTYLPDDVLCEKYKQDFVKLVKMRKIPTS